MMFSSATNTSTSGGVESLIRKGNRRLLGIAHLLQPGEHRPHRRLRRRRAEQRVRIRHGQDPADARFAPCVATSRIGNDIAFDFTQSPLSPARFVVLCYSMDLVTWLDVPEQLYHIAGHDPVRNVILYRVIIPIITSNRLFVRLKRIP